MKLNRRQKIATTAVAGLALAGASFGVGRITPTGHASYNPTTHRLSMAGGSVVQVNCNGDALHYQELQHTIGGVTCDPSSTSSTSTTTNPSSSTTAVPPTTVAPPTDCPLTIAGRQCWEARTGVPGWTEAQIVAGLSPLRHSTGDQTITIDGTVIDGQWIDGCLAIKASNVTIRNSLIRSSSPCTGGDGQAGPSTINSGVGNGSGSIRNLQIVDSEVDAGQTDDSYDYIGIGSADYSLLRVNAHGTTHTVWAGNRVSVRDSYIHDPTEATVTRHNETVNSDSGSNVSFVHNWISSVNGNRTQGITGAFFAGDHWGAPHDYTIVGNFFEGGRGADLVLAATMTNTVVTGNRLSPNTAYGNLFTYEFRLNAGDVWSDNLNSETLTPINP